MGLKMTRANVDLKPSRYGPAVAMPKTIPQDDLSLTAASQSEGLDKATGLQVWSRTCYTHVH